MNKRILIIDDCLPILNALRILLGLYHYTVDISPDEQYLLDNKNPLPDIILVDYHIPGIDGFNMLQQLKQHPRLKEIPIILMSGDINIEQRSILLGVNDFIVKPIDIDLLLEKIERCMTHTGVLCL